MTDSSILVVFEGRSWVVWRGTVATVGRSQTSTVRLPEDDYLSRRAASLTVLDDCVLIRNTSQRKPLAVRPPFGEDRVVEPGAATTSLPHRHFDLVFLGRAGNVVAVQVHAGRLAAPPEDRPSAAEPPTRSKATAAEPIVMTPAQRRVLTALCASLLTGTGGGAVPATYTQIGDRLGLRPQYVRNVIKSLREVLAGHGVSGLTRDCGEGPADDFRGALARWAIRNGQVTMDDVVGDDGTR
jgi:hypothetical protein